MTNDCLIRARPPPPQRSPRGCSLHAGLRALAWTSCRTDKCSLDSKRAREFRLHVGFNTNPQQCVTDHPWQRERRESCVAVHLNVHLRPESKDSTNLQ